MPITREEAEAMAGRLEDAVLAAEQTPDNYYVLMLARDKAIEAAAALRSLVEERDELRKALRPFISFYEPWMDEWPDERESTSYARVTFGQLRRARAALKAPAHE